MAVKVLAGLVVAFVLWALLRTQSPDEMEQATLRRSIDLCWADQQRKALTPDQARFIAGACESMVAQYRSRWGHAP